MEKEIKATENPVVKDMVKDTAASVKANLQAKVPVKVEKTLPAKTKPAAKKKAATKAPAGTTPPAKKVVTKTKSKKTPASSIKKLQNWGVSAKAKAHETNSAIKKLEAEALEGILAVRKLVGKATDKLSVFGHSNHGMAARVDEALMKYEPSNFPAILVHVASGDNTARRSKSTEHDKMVTHMLNHLKRCSGNGSQSEFKFKKPLAKVNLDKQSGVICKNMAPTLRLLQAYAFAGAPKKAAPVKNGAAKVKTTTKGATPKKIASA